MNVQEYISSSIVQSYVLGLASESERAEFERMCDMHAEVRAAREEFEIAVEEHALRNGAPPAANVKGKIFSAIGMESTFGPLAGTSRQQRTEISSEGEGDVSGGEFRQQAKVMAAGSWTRLISAAASVLLLISIGFNFYLYNKSKQSNERYQDLLAQQSQLVTNNGVLQARLDEYENAMSMMNDPAMAVVKMPAIPDGPDSSSLITVYWDTRTKDVFLDVNKLPEPAAGQQYQLWAMVDGTPVDAGVFEVKEGPAMQKMKNVPRAEAFAVTLEKRGGSPKPSLDKLYVMGKV